MEKVFFEPGSLRNPRPLRSRNDGEGSSE
jgi:hypothetical protein